MHCIENKCGQTLLRNLMVENGPILQGVNAWKLQGQNRPRKIITSVWGYIVM